MWRPYPISGRGRCLLWNLEIPHGCGFGEAIERRSHTPTRHGDGHGLEATEHGRWIGAEVAEEETRVDGDEGEYRAVWVGVQQVGGLRGSGRGQGHGGGRGHARSGCCYGIGSVDKC